MPLVLCSALLYFAVSDRAVCWCMCACVYVGLSPPMHSGSSSLSWLQCFSMCLEVLSRMITYQQQQLTPIALLQPAGPGSNFLEGWVPAALQLQHAHVRKGVLQLLLGIFQDSKRWGFYLWHSLTVERFQALLFLLLILFWVWFIS